MRTSTSSVSSGLKIPVGKNGFSKNILVILGAIGFLTFIIAFMLLPVGEENKLSPAQTENLVKEDVVYRLEGQAKAKLPDTVQVSGSTNLPNGSMIEVVVNRIYTYHGEDEEQTGFVGVAETTVRNGQYDASVMVDDKEFLDIQKVSGFFIKNFNENVEVVISFRPIKAQSSDVLKIVGPNGEKLASSPQKQIIKVLPELDSPVKELISQNILEIKSRIKLPFPYTDELPKYSP